MNVDLAVLGCGYWGKNLVRVFSELGALRCVCDTDASRRQAMVFQGPAPAFTDNLTEVLNNPGIRAVAVATPATTHYEVVNACLEAGKDVFVEKPCSHNIFEGRKCVEAARKYERIVQHGTQSRSSKSWAKQVAAVASGKYGKLLVSKAWASKNGSGRWSIGFKPTKEPPENLDFNIWLGPAPQQPYHENIVHYNWHWFWDFGNGEIGNQGVHQMDIARWAIPGGRLPTSVISMGGRWVNSTEGHPPFTDQAQTPNCQLTVMDFGGPLLVFEVIGLVDRAGLDGKKYPPKVGNEFYLEEGVIKEDENKQTKFFPKSSNKAEDLVNVDVEMGPGDIFENFIQCVRTRNRKDLHAGINKAHLSAACCHLGNISYRLGQQVSGTNRPDVLDKHEEVAKSWETIEQTVKGTLDLDLSKSTYQLGPMLKFNPKTEKFVDNAEADKLLTRPYRAPFVVPEDV